MTPDHQVVRFHCMAWRYELLFGMGLVSMVKKIICGWRWTWPWVLWVGSQKVFLRSVSISIPPNDVNRIWKGNDLRSKRVWELSQRNCGSHIAYKMQATHASNVWCRYTTYSSNNTNPASPASQLFAPCLRVTYLPRRCHLQHLINLVSAAILLFKLPSL